MKITRIEDASMAEVRIELEHEVRKFDGELIAGPVSTRGQDRPRWMEMRLWRHANGGYVFYRLGRSVVYHDPQKTIYRDGSLVTVDELPDDAIPCHAVPRKPGVRRTCRCFPPWPDDLPDGEQVMLESPRHTLDRCADVAAVLSRLTRANTRLAGVASSGMSEPAKQLAAEAVANDDGFRDFFHNVDKPVAELA